MHGTDLTVSMADLKKWHTELLTVAGLEVAKMSEWSGNVHTIMCILAVFGERLKEIRFTPVGITTGKETSGAKVETTTVDFKTLGIETKHRQFCSGSTFKPFVKSGLAQSLGPMTQACHLALGGDDKFNVKWEQALIRTFHYIPDLRSDCAPDADCNADEFKEVLTRLCHILMMVGGREQRHVTLSLSAIMYLLYVKTMGEGETHSYVFSEEVVKTLDFSGKGAFFHYRQLMTDK